jgi:hypothetical protein
VSDRALRLHRMTALQGDLFQNIIDKDST